MSASSDRDKILSEIDVNTETSTSLARKLGVNRARAGQILKKMRLEEAKKTQLRRRKQRIGGMKGAAISEGIRGPHPKRQRRTKGDG